MPREPQPPDDSDLNGDEDTSTELFPPHVVVSWADVHCTRCGNSSPLSKFTRAQDLRAFVEIHAHDE